MEDRQVLAASEEGYGQLHWRCLRPGKDGGDRRGLDVVVDILRGASLERHVRTVFVVPCDECAEFISHTIESVGHQDPACALIFERAHKPLNDGNAAVLPNGAEANCYATGFGPE